MHVTRTLRAAALCAAVVTLAAGCASTDDGEGFAPLAHPYKVVLLPVEGADAALAVPAGVPSDPEEGEVPFAMTADELRETIRRGILDANVFSEIVEAQSAQLVVDEFTDTVAAATGLARRERADLIMRVSVSSARLQDLGPNDDKVWSSLSWFMIGPIFAPDDRNYATSLVVNAELFDPGDPVKPTASVVAASAEETLDVWDRGFSWEIIYTPPAWIEGDLEDVSQELTERAVQQMMAQLVEELRTRDIPSRFVLAVALEGSDLAITIESRRRLRSLSVRSGDTVLREWAERETSELVNDASRPDVTVYTARVPVPAGTRGLLRVVAEDEAGGREVRSIPVERTVPAPAGEPAPEDAR
jgi:hypothetical protein